MTYLRPHGPNPKPVKQPKKPRRGLPPVSAKKRAYRKSEAGREGQAYMVAVKGLPCVICGSPPPNDAHHCKDVPPDGRKGLYQQLPAAGRKSGDKDTIPLCRSCHQTGPEAYHKNRTAWREKHGPDYGFIGPTRAAVANHEIDF
jgi:hypothetical protein